MKKTVIILGTVLVFGLQWFFASKMILDQENVVATGTAYKFKTRPLDPTDPFRGKYVALRFEAETYKIHEDAMPYSETLYVYLKEDHLGYAEVDTVVVEPLERTQDYVTASYNSHYGGTLRFNYDFDRFYMKENKAYDAEVVMRPNRNLEEQLDCYAIVYVKDGKSVLDNVMIEDMPIKDYVKENRPKTGL